MKRFDLLSRVAWAESNRKMLPVRLRSASSRRYSGADRDLVAAQYANGFREVLASAAPWILEGTARGWSIDDAIVHAHLRLMRAFPDSLIARKCGKEVARKSAVRAESTLASGEPGDAAYRKALYDFDVWLRADGHRRNPGTTADMIGAALFALLRDGLLNGSGSLCNLEIDRND